MASQDFLPSFANAMIIVLLFLLSSSFCKAEIPCESDSYCQQILQRDDSLCIDEKCSNPFQGGCLKTAGITTSPVFEGRVCNSDDEETSSSCVPPRKRLNYPEIRIHHANWETSIFQAWIYQIILMEILGIPATVGLTTSDTSTASFYSPRNTIEYSAETYPYHAIKTANQVEDCSKTEDPCVHVLPEVWEGQRLEIDPLVADGSIMRPAANGQVGMGGYHIPAFTAEEFPALGLFYGFQGESRRKFLAETFKRPTTWLEYCQEVSESKCGIADDTATRFPSSEDEEKLYFSEGQYRGYFRFNESTGYIVSYPCTWSHNTEGILFWNNIVGLKMDGPEVPAGGYGGSSIGQIWRAANATKSHVIVKWYEPDRLIEDFRGTDAEFQRVSFPAATQECTENRPTNDMKCSNDTVARRGPEIAKCDDDASSTVKVVSRYVGDYNFRVEEAYQSPAMDVITAVRLTKREVNQILNTWLRIGTDVNGNDAREAVCGWVVDNIDRIMGFIPFSFPRTLMSNDPYQQPLLYGARSLSILSLLFVLTATVVVYVSRKERVMMYAQVDFILILLGGLALVALGAILSSIEPSISSCNATIWLIVMGYTLELAPLIVKASAINKMMSASSRMKRVKLRRRTLFGFVFVISMVSLIFMICWTALDPWTLQQQLVLSSGMLGENNDSGIVYVTSFCGSIFDGWMYTTSVWQMLLLLWATVLAIQMRKVRSEFNESQQLAFVIYSHFIFVVLQVVVMWLDGILPLEEIAGYRSFILSFDVIATIVIYFTPKLLRLYAPVKSRKFKESVSYAVKRASMSVFAARGSNMVPGSASATAANGPSQLPIRTEQQPAAEDMKKLEKVPAKDLSLEQLEKLLAVRRETLQDQRAQDLTVVNELHEEEDSTTSGGDGDLADLSNVDGSSCLVY